MIRNLLLYVCTFIFLLAFPQQNFADDPIRDSVVKIHTTSRAPDFARPWSKRSSRKSSGTGVVIDSMIDGLAGDGPLILTNAHVVSYGIQIYVQPNHTTDKFAAKVVAIAPGIDLAILRLVDPEVIAESPKLSLAMEPPTVKETVNVYGFPLGGDDLSVTEGIVSRIEFATYYFSVSGVRIQVDAALNPGNSGGPAVTNAKITGLVSSRIQEADNIGYLIPASEIRLFLEDVSDGQYDGKPAFHGSLQTAENAALRKRLGMTPAITGMVVGLQPDAEQNQTLKRWDVITHIGPHALDNRGMVRVRDDLRLYFQHFVTGLVENGKIPLTVFRSGKKEKIEVGVDRGPEKLLPTLKYEYPEYAILGPLVFTPAAYESVHPVVGSFRGFSLFSSRKSPLVSRFSDEPAFPGEQLVIVTNRMFSHPIKKGYGSPVLNVVTDVNGKSVKNLEHLVELVRDANEEYLEFTFAGKNEVLIFRRDEFFESAETILEAEGIRYQFSPRLREVWQDGEQK